MASTGFSVLAIPKILLVVIIALIVLGASAIFYTHDIDIRDAEAVLMAKQISDCTTNKGTININNINNIKKGQLITECGIRGREIERIFVKTEIIEKEKTIKELYSGDEGTLWIQQAYGDKTEYNPGYYEGKETIAIQKEDGSTTIGQLKTTVLIKQNA